MEIFDTIRRHTSMLTYIYLNVDECWLISSKQQQMCKLQIFLNYAIIPKLLFLEVNWFNVTHVLANLINRLNLCMARERL